MSTGDSSKFRICKSAAVLLIAVLLTACGGGSGGGGGGGGQSYTVGGAVTGLSGSGLVLEDNGADDLKVSSAGSFTFATQLASGAKYGVTVKTQPSSPSQTCVVGNGSGTVGSSDVINVTVACTTIETTVGVTVTGLAGSGLVLQDNGGDDLAVSANGSLKFATQLASGAKYGVTVKTQPSSPSQTCVVSNGSGTVGSSGVVNVTVTCTTLEATVGVLVTGLTGSGLVLQDNGGDDLAVSANGSLKFATAVASGAAYNVTIKTSPTAPTQVCALANASGTVGSGNITNVVVSCGPLTLLAGALGNAGNVDGIGATARFATPEATAVDAAGNVYVADAEDDAIRKITPNGVVSTFAGKPGVCDSTNGTGAAARFCGPSGVAVDAAGNVYVADTGNSTIRKITPAAVVSTLAGTAQIPGSTDTKDGSPSFNRPIGVAADTLGNVYVADTGNDTIRKITAAGVVTTFAGVAGTPGHSDTKDGTPLFYAPAGVATDATGDIYVADTDNSTIRKITPAGVVTTLAGVAGSPGATDDTNGGTGAGRFQVPYGVAVDSTGTVYVADTYNFLIRKVTPGGSVSTLAGGIEGALDGSGTAAQFEYPLGIATDSAGYVYVADTDNFEIRKINPAGVVSTLAGSSDHAGAADGTGGAARFNAPQGVVVDSKGNIYVADETNSAIRKITPAGVVSTFAGKMGEHGSADDPAGTVGAARFFYPYGMAIDSTDTIYVADEQNCTIRKITPDGHVTTLAGQAGVAPGSADGVGANARFYDPQAVAVDAEFNVYVADTVNDTIRVIDPTGKVSTLAGGVGKYAYADGTGTVARFEGPTGVTVDTAGNVYVADNGNNMIRKISPAGVVTTLSGSQTAGTADGTSGPGGTARFSGPWSIAIDAAGNLYVGDGELDGSGTIRKIDTSGNVTTVVGTAGSQGVVLGPLPGSLNTVGSVALLPGTGTTLIVTDYVENAVLEISLP